MMSFFKPWLTGFTNRSPQSQEGEHHDGEGEEGRSGEAKQRGPPMPADDSQVRELITQAKRPDGIELKVMRSLANIARCRFGKYVITVRKMKVYH